MTFYFIEPLNFYCVLLSPRTFIFVYIKDKLDWNNKIVQQFRFAITKYVVMKGLEINFVKNERKMVSAKCKKKCSWKLFASIDSSNDTLTVKSYHRHYNCDRVNKIYFIISLL